MKKHSINRIVAVAAALFLAAGLLAGCGAGQPGAAGTGGGNAAPDTRTVFAMDTVMNLTAYGGGEEVLDQAEARIRQLEKLFSATDPESEIYAVNRDGQGAVSEDTFALTEYGLQLCRQTEGALDLSVYPVVKAWGFTTGQFRVPGAEELAQLLSHVDYRKIRLDSESRTISLEPGMMMDLGSIAKGYTGDQVIRILEEKGVESALLDLGGNIQTLGPKPDGSDWRIAVQNPEEPSSDNYLGIVEVRDCAVVTSGGYERYFEGSDGTRYWHIMDPATGTPADSGLISVTVVGDCGVYCDALSTSLFIMGEEKAAQFWRDHGDFDMILVGSDHQITVTEGLRDRFTLMDTEDYEVKLLEK
ncbi:MAG: FAD:protein FMN transferase [Anaerovoracaceae bacterium]